MLAEALPVARVVVDTPLAHLDRPFDYLVTAEQSDAAQPGVRVRVRFAGRKLDGFVIDRVATSDHDGRLGVIDRVVSPEPVLAPEILALARSVAERYAGRLPDVLRLAVPPRHARTEQLPEPEPVVGVMPVPDPAGWTRYQAGPAFVGALGRNRPARAVWQALPGEDWPLRLAELAATVAATGRGALLIVPDARDLRRLDAALTTVLGPGRHVTLTAEQGPSARYRRFLAVRRGRTKVVAGTRAAAFAPVHDVGLVAVFDDGDDLLAEPRSPYPHVREVLMLRSAQQRAALLVGGFARTAESQLLLDSGWAHEIVADRATVRAAAPRIEAAGDQYATGADSAAARSRLSPAAFAAARAALDTGAPVLVQVPRAGYQPGLACARCRRSLRCRNCSGPLGRNQGAPPHCRWCGRPDAHVICSACGSTAMRSTVTGAGRTAEEVGRAFPGVPVLTSAGESVQATVPDAAALVVATPGAEPVAPDGYGAALLLDGDALLGRPDLRAAEETLRRWMTAAALVRPAPAGGRVVVGADASLAVVQALIRWDPGGHAAAELAARRELGFPPAVVMASLEGPATALPAEPQDLGLSEAEFLGPVPVEGAPDSGRERLLVRVGPLRRKELAGALVAFQARRSARKDPQPVRVQLDPTTLL